MTLTKIEPKHALDAYIGMDVVTYLDASYKAVHSVVLAWVDNDLAPGGPPDYVRSGQDSHGPYPSRVEAIAAARDFGRAVNAHRKLIDLPPKQWRYR